MGLAASQARLLSITSRLSDNELRTQLINNSKMRLATESSRVSEDYINALNSATMMMTNYDVNGNETTQALTFNALTAYSPSNNQYGLVDTNGRILVSGKEANKFVQSGGNLDNFLELHDLKYTTSYFKGSTFGDWFDPADNIVNLKMEDENGEPKTYASYSPEELKAMYLGGSLMVEGMKKTYPSYEATQMSSEYYNYLEKYAKYDEEVSKYVEDYWNKFNTYLNSALDTVTMADIKTTFNDVLGGSMSSPSIGTGAALETYMDALEDKVKDLTPERSTYCSDVKNEIAKLGYLKDNWGNLIVQVGAPEVATIERSGDRIRVLKLGAYVEGYNTNNVKSYKYQDSNDLMTSPSVDEKKYQITITDWAGTTGFNVNVYGLETGDNRVFIGSGITSDTSTSISITEGKTTNFKKEDLTGNKVWKVGATEGTIPLSVNSINKNSGGQYYAAVTLVESDSEGDEDGEDTTSPTTYYVKLKTNTDADGKITSYSVSDTQLYKDSTFSSSADYGNQVWDRDTGTAGVEKYNSDHWANLQTFMYTNQAGELFKVVLGDENTNTTFNSGSSGSIKQTVTKAIIGSELKDIEYQLESKIRLEIVKEQELFNIEDAKRILLNCILPSKAKQEDKDAAEKEMDAYYAALQETVYQYLDSLFGGREVDKDGNMVFKQDKVDANGVSLYQKLYEELWQSADKIGDIKWVMGFVEDHHAYTSIIEENETYNAIKSIGVLEQLFDTFGEPKMGWVDTSDNNSDGTKKAEWYTNLFNKMKDGYKVLEQGLTGSKDWIQYALESGLATVVQVDKARNWTGAGYKNIKEITEVVDEKAVAVAEAQYNKAMNDIENKDKRFDMELKNIDTEHNALQQEYETIKSVISKNVERTFKYYS